MDGLDTAFSRVNVAPSLPTCEHCHRSAAEIAGFDASARQLMCCARCQQHGVHAYYCSRDCQVADRNHKLVCGAKSPSSTQSSSTPTAVHAPPPAPLTEFPPDSSLSFELVTLLNFLRVHHSTYAYLFQLPSRPVPIPLPVSLDEPTIPLFHCLLRTASFGNTLAVELLHTLLVDAVVAVGGREEQLTRQLSAEFGFDLASRLLEDVEPSEDDLTAAVGGEGCFGLLLQWQLKESERSR